MFNVDKRNTRTRREIYSKLTIWTPERHRYFNNLPANIYLFKVNNRNTRKRFETWLKLTIETPEQRQ